MSATQSSPKRVAKLRAGLPLLVPARGKTTVERRISSGSPLPGENAQAVSTQMALHALAFNMKRVTRILGVGGLMEAISA
jgi:hypothetical protein